MTADDITLLAIRGSIAGMKPADQALIEAAAASIRTLVASHPGGHGLMAVVLVGAELAVEGGQ